jgi:malonyl-CoA O-methyltransferase
MLSARQVGDAFGRAARSYDQYASLQRAVATSLLAGLPEMAPRIAVDLGAGTAPLSWQFRRDWPQTRWLALDVSEPMLREGIDRGRLGDDFTPVVADAARLPLADESVDCLFSSFALQWCGDLTALSIELNRVLAPGGTLAFSVPVAGTLSELEQSWQAVDNEQHVNRLQEPGEWQAALFRAGLKYQQAHCTTVREHYPDLRAVGSMLKFTGAHRVDRDRPAGLTSPRKLKQLVQAYEQFREPEGLPVTWQVLYVVVEKQAASSAGSQWRQAL